MGVWGTGLFSDDTAAEIRDSYQDYLGDGLSGVKATDKLINQYKPDKYSSDIDT
jgi:hypothetical protein